MGNRRPVPPHLFFGASLLPEDFPGAAGPAEGGQRPFLGRHGGLPRRGPTAVATLAARHRALRGRPVRHLPIGRQGTGRPIPAAAGRPFPAGEEQRRSGTAFPFLKIGLRRTLDDWSNSIQATEQRGGPAGRTSRRDWSSFREVSGLSWGELAACLGVDHERVTSWRRGVMPRDLALSKLYACGPADPRRDETRCFPTIVDVLGDEE